MVMLPIESSARHRSEREAMTLWLLRAGAAGHQLMAKDYFRLIWSLSSKTVLLWLASGLG